MSNHRGTPIVGLDPSVIPGTDPLHALLAKESREERRGANRQNFHLEIANHRLRMRQIDRRSRKEA